MTCGGEPPFRLAGRCFALSWDVNCVVLKYATVFALRHRVRTVLEDESA